ncbi:hypothetical protein Holit_02890 [Hollandina sp. SP2]
MKPSLDPLKQVETVAEAVKTRRKLPAIAGEINDNQVGCIRIGIIVVLLYNTENKWYSITHAIQCGI